MAQIVAFSVESKAQGEEALDRLRDVAEDAAMVYRTDRGRIRIEQSSDMTVGKGLVRGGLLGGAVSIFAGPLVGMAAAGGALGGAYGALRDKGVPDKVMKLAGQQLEKGQAAVFVLADEPTAQRIESEVRAAGIAGIEVGSFPEEAAGVVRETLKLA